MTTNVLGKLYTLLELAPASDERKALMQKALGKLLLAEQIRLLGALTDKTLLDEFVKNFSAKLKLRDGGEKELIDSELATLQKAAE